MAVYMWCIRVFGVEWDSLRWRTVFHRASWRSLMRLNPVVKMFPSAKKMALIGRAPSWALSFSWKQKHTCQTGGAMFAGCESTVWCVILGKIVPHVKHPSSKSLQGFFFPPNLPPRPFFYGGRWRGPSCPCRRCRVGCRCGSSWH